MTITLVLTLLRTNEKTEIVYTTYFIHYYCSFNLSLVLGECKRGEVAVPKCMLDQHPGIPYTLGLVYQIQWPLQASFLSLHLQALKYKMYKCRKKRRHIQ